MTITTAAVKVYRVQLFTKGGRHTYPQTFLDVDECEEVAKKALRSTHDAPGWMSTEACVIDATRVTTVRKVTWAAILREDAIAAGEAPEVDPFVAEQDDLTVSLPEAVASALHAEAARKGVSAEALAAATIEERYPVAVALAQAAAADEERYPPAFAHDEEPF